MLKRRDGAIVIKKTENIGFCSGVRRAIDLADKLLTQYDKLYVTGELVHNSYVMKRLFSKGLRLLDKNDMPSGEVCLIQAHGVDPAIRQALFAKGNEIIDGTCPIVSRSFEINQKLARQGYQVFVFGKRSHPEMMALKGLVEDIDIIENADEIDGTLEGVNGTQSALTAQTTMPRQAFQDLIVTIHRRLKMFDSLLVYNTICDATVLREEEIIKASGREQAVLVIGGENSSNTRKLYQLAKERNENSYLVHNLAGVKTIEQNISDCHNVIIASGTSTPMEQVERIEQYLITRSVGG